MCIILGTIFVLIASDSFVDSSFIMSSQITREVN